jgi:hypothetical protein
MNSFEKWRREVNIILHNTVGYSLRDLAEQGDFAEHVEENVRRLFENGEDPIDGAQYIAEEIDPSLDVEQILADKLGPKQKPLPKKNLRKFRVENET